MEMRRRKPALTGLEAVLILLVVLVWLVVFTQAVTRETRTEYRLDSTGQPVEVLRY